jgi:hypothetical protein
MSFIDRIKQKSKKKNENIPSNSVSIIKIVEAGIHSSRIETCKSCEHLIKITNTCKKCGCFMSLKTKLEDAVCPIGKW